MLVFDLLSKRRTAMVMPRRKMTLMVSTRAVIRCEWLQQPPLLLAVPPPIMVKWVEDAKEMLSSSRFLLAATPPDSGS